MSPPKIGQLLVEAGLVDQRAIEHALSVQRDQGGGRLVNVLVSLGYLTPAQFLEFMTTHTGIAQTDLARFEIGRDLVSLVPRELASKHEVVPIDRMGDVLIAGMACPLDAAAVQEIESVTGMKLKPVLCSAQDVRKAIERYYPPDDAIPALTAASIAGLESSMRLYQVARLIRRIKSLPALPETVARVREAMSDPKSSIRDVAEVITLDPPIAAKLLSVANSAAYGFPQRVDDIGLAVSLLGLRETYSMVLSCSVLNAFRKRGAFDYRVFWVESMCCAAASRIVAKASGNRDLFGVFAAGLLHDLGRVALAEVIPDVYCPIDQYLPPSGLLAEEEKTLGLTHPEAGYELATHWQLPAEIAEPIRFHHRPDLATAARANVAITSLATVLVRAVGTRVEDNAAIFAGHEHALSVLHLDTEVAEAMLDEFLRRRETSFGDVLGFD